MSMTWHDITQRVTAAGVQDETPLRIMDIVIAWVRRSEYGILVVAGVAVLFVAIKIVRHRRQRRRALGLPETGVEAPSARGPGAPPPPPGPAGS